MNFIFSFLIIAILNNLGLGVDVTCPTAAITQNTPAGAFPAGGSSIFPANYNCTIQFQIPVGQVVRINITNNLFFDTNDTLTIQDSASTLYSLFVIDKLFYLPATTGKIMISTQTNTSSFYFKWQYIPVTNFNRVLNPTGTVLALNLTAGSYYQFTSTRGQVAFHTGSLSGYSDGALAQIYVYDGADLNANFIGNLKVFTDMENVSIGRSLTLVNFYGTSVPSYGIANDYAAISNYDDYDFFVLRSDMDFFRHLISKQGKESAMTLYAISSPETYISTIKFLNPNVTGQEVRVKPATPTENYGNLLTYNVRDFTDGQLPQQILTKTFTCDVYFGARSRPSIDWHQANPGRTGWIYSASLWNPTAVITDPYYTYFNSTNPVKFVFDIQSVKIGKPGEALKVEVGSSTSSSVSVVLNTTVTNTGEKAAHGTYMTTNFTGTSNKSSFAMKFTIEFLIPHGYVVKIDVQTNLIYGSQDHFVIKDSASSLMEMNIVDNLFYAPVGTNSINITTKTNTSTFYFTWKFIDVTTFTRNQFSTGQIVSLNLTANNYYRFTSANDRVVFTSGSISGTPDLSTKRIYVYDGDDLNAMFIGNLYDGYVPNGSSGNTITLVNFYGLPVLSYGIANEDKVISKYDGYSLQIMTQARDFFTQGTSMNGREVATTLYSLDSQEFYITTVTFLNKNLTGQEVRVMPQTPMDGYANLLTYSSNDTKDTTIINLPQQVLSNTFTVLFFRCDVYFSVRPRPSNEWATVGPGRTGMMYSPSMWNPKTQQAAPYSSRLYSSIPVNFVMELTSVSIGKAGDTLEVNVGSNSSSLILAQTNQTISGAMEKSAMGTYMTTTFTGTTGASSFAMKFSVLEAKASAKTMINVVALVMIFMNLF